MAFTTRDGKTHTALAEINMVPFIDVVLVLLIIFMITAPVIQSGIQVDVPETTSVRELSDSLIVVNIDKTEGVYLGDTKLNIHEIVDKIREQLPKLKDKSVYLRSDRDVRFGQVATVMDTLKEGGIEHIVVVTKPFENKR
jgi:biopolymer transport protein TolR